MCKPQIRIKEISNSSVSLLTNVSSVSFPLCACAVYTGQTNAVSSVMKPVQTDVCHFGLYIIFHLFQSGCLPKIKSSDFELSKLEPKRFFKPVESPKKPPCPGQGQDRSSLLVPSFYQNQRINMKVF